jgi:tetratricopeptide (TPR) repeat protein
MKRMTMTGRGLVVWALLAVTGCVTVGPRSVGPEDIPALQERAAREPDNGRNHFLLAAALSSADRCDEAVISARRGRALLPEDPTGPILIGQCLEKSGDYDAALNLYAQFLFDHGDTPGAQAVEGRREVALRYKARQAARSAILNEESMAPAEPETVGVLPFIVDGDSAYQALSLGLAHMLTTDLALLRRFPLVERAQLDALLQEMALDPERIDPATAARTGRLMRASRMVLGTVSVPSDTQARLGGNIVLETGEIAEPLATQGALGDLLSLEKDLALQVAAGLGYQVTEAERQRILENQPSSLAAFLAFSKGLLAESQGDFQGAAGFYGEAAGLDPQYGEAETKLRETAGVELGQARIAELTFVPVPEPTVMGELGPMANTLTSSILDIASHQPERATIGAGSGTSIVDLLPEDAEIFPLLGAVITITITIRR